MKLVFVNLFLLVACAGIVNYVTANAHELTFEVTSMVGHENDYLQLKRQRPSLRRPAEEKLRQKEDICMAILADEFFDVHKVEMVNPNHKTIYKQLKQQHPDVHDEHFKSSENIKPSFANPYKPGDVSVLGKITREYMFTCIARNCTTKTIHQYFVSPKYTVTEGGLTKMVRYVFERNNKKEIVLMAKAVEKKVIESPDPVQKTTAKATPASKARSPEESRDSYEDSKYDDDDDRDTDEDEEDEDDESW